MYRMMGLAHAALARLARRLRGAGAGRARWSTWR